MMIHNFPFYEQTKKKAEFHRVSLHLQLLTQFTPIAYRVMFLVIPICFYVVHKLQKEIMYLKNKVPGYRQTKEPK